MRASLKKRIQEKLHWLVRQGVAPGAQLALGWKDKTLGVYNSGVRDGDSKRPVRSSTWFDLASLTKILATIDLVMTALQEKKIADLHQPLKTWFPSFASELKSKTLHDLMNHRAGLPPVFENLEDLPTRNERIRYFLQEVDKSYKPSEPKEIYSDVGYMLLGILLERVFDGRLRDLLVDRKEIIYGPLVIHTHGWKAFWHSLSGASRSVASSLSLDRSPRRLAGVVQDPRAQWLHGDAGHSGLFGTARGIEEWGKELFKAYHGKGLRWSDKIVRELIAFDKRDSYGRFINGFDTPSKDGTSQAGKHASSTVVGHLGYTGVSFWMDIERGDRVTLLTHRFAKGIDAERLRELRPEFHDWLKVEVFDRISF